MNLDLPIALGIAILFVRSAVDILTGTGFGYVDSLCGLVFFLLLGRLFQQRTYDSLNFDRTYASYFPLAVTMKRKDGESTVPVTSLEPGDRVIIRNNEIVPADAILMSDAAAIDYSFVTGESTPVPAKQGDLVHAGGRQVGSAIELEVVKTVSQSYLTQLWNDAAFRTDRPGNLTRLTNIAGKYFTARSSWSPSGAAMYWFPRDTVTAWNAVTAVLIVACPCALALSTPFAFGTALRVFGRGKFYAKHADVVEWMGRIRTVIFDKTGTLTHARGSGVRFVGEPLSPIGTIGGAIAGAQFAPPAEPGGVRCPEGRSGPAGGGLQRRGRRRHQRQRCRGSPCAPGRGCSVALLPRTMTDAHGDR